MHLRLLLLLKPLDSSKRLRLTLAAVFFAAKAVENIKQLKLKEDFQ